MYKYVFKQNIVGILDTEIKFLILILNSTNY
jgi:hypothetical protein